MAKSDSLSVKEKKVKKVNKVDTVKKEKAIMFAVNSELYFALGVLILNIISIEPDTYDFLVYEDDLTDEQKDFLVKLTKNRITFVHYEISDWCKEHKIQQQEFGRAINRYSHLNFSKHKIFQSLAEYKRILYLDVDMMVRTDLKEIFSCKGVVVTGSSLVFLDTFKRQMGEKLFNLVDFSGIEPDSHTVNGGLFYAEDSCDYASLYTKAVEFMSFCLNNESPKTGLDELVFMYTCFTSSITPQRLPREKYNSRFFQHGVNPSVIHFQGNFDCKPWSSDKNWQLIYPEWYYYYRQWLDMGGMPYKEEIQQDSKNKLISSYFSNEAFIKVINLINMSRYPKLVFLGKNSSAPNVFNFAIDDNTFYVKVLINGYPVFNYVIGFKTTARCYLADKGFVKKLKTLVENNSLLKFNSSNENMEVSTVSLSENELGVTFGYFYNLLQNL